MKIKVSKALSETRHWQSAQSVFLCSVFARWKWDFKSWKPLLNTILLWEGSLKWFVQPSEKKYVCAICQFAFLDGPFDTLIFIGKLYFFTLQCNKVFPIKQKRTSLTRNPFSSPYGNRTRVSAVRGRRLNRLTNEPFIILSNDWLYVKSFFSFIYKAI